MKKIIFAVVIILFFFCSLSLVHAATELKNHALLGKTVTNSDYVFVIKGDNKSFGEDRKFTKIAQRLISIDGRFSTFNYPDENLEVVNVFEPQNEFKVVAVYESDPRIFNSPYQFTILEREGKKYISPIIFNNEIMWQINDCSKDRYCNYWRQAFAECYAAGSCSISFQLNILDEKNYRVFIDPRNPQKVRPPYPEAWVNNSLKGFREYAKKHPKMDLKINDIHLNVTANKITVNQLGDMFLHLEKLNIGDGVAIVMSR